MHESEGNATGRREKDRTPVKGGVDLHNGNNKMSDVDSFWRKRVERGKTSSTPSHVREKNPAISHNRHEHKQNDYAPEDSRCIACIAALLYVLLSFDSVIFRRRLRSFFPLV